MKLPKSPLLFPVFLFTLGALISFLTSFPLFKLYPIGIGLFLFSTLVHFFKNFSFFKTLLIYSCFFLLGLIYFKAYYTPDKNHFQTLKGTPHAIKQIEIESMLGDYSFSTNYSGKIIGWGASKVHGKVLIRQSKDGRSKSWLAGQRILTTEAIQNIKDPFNPGQFSYKGYLMNKRINHQIDLNSANSFLLPKSKITLRSSSSNLENSIFQRIEKSTLSVSSQGMLKALLFADRDALDEGIIKNYTQAGVIHLLALSGLHIGLFAGFLMFFLRPLKK